ncbi:MAG: Gldg family protein [Granulosicoccus sp.]|nr:Gldg family protein [Granulosicoccus sp.]
MSPEPTNSIHKQKPLRVVSTVAAKELLLFLSSPIAWLFIASFAAVTLFVFFWAEAFFARNIADVRPMFEWMPVLLILLCSTLTMRMWSEERRTGTLEHVLTQPAKLWSFAVGKYIACMVLLLLALIVVVPLPITISSFSDIDWGPVISGFVATLLLGSAYIAIGLYVSTQTPNQIVSLIGSVVLCAVFYFIGHNVITDTLGQRAGEWLQSIGTGARFDSITRGVIDFSDLIYYLTLSVVFLVLTVFSLERERWAATGDSSSHVKWKLTAALLVLNAIAINLWVGQLNALRLDTTRGQQYTLSDATRNYLSQLQEPLTLRGYFSAKTHPLLSPLVPQMRDLLNEYEVAGKGRVRVEIVDPLENPEAEVEANQQYGIEPVPFQVADRYQSSIVSSYFNVLIQYGNEYDVLGFRDLIDVKSRSESNLDVQLRNPEYDLTRSIRKVLTDFQTAGSVFNNISSPVTLHMYASSDAQLPADLVSFKQEIKLLADNLAAESNNKLIINLVDPNANGGRLGQQLATQYGLRPMSAGLFSTDRFWFHTLLEAEGQLVQIPLGDLSANTFESNLDTGLKRFAKGFTRRIGLVTPAPNPQGIPGSTPGFRSLENYLRAEYDVVREDISDGTVASDIELLILAAPDSVDEKSLFAIDQFLMQGGTIVASTSNFQAQLSRNNLTLTKHTSGLNEWLTHHGITFSEQLVMDPLNAAFPAPVTRNVGGLQLQEMRMLDYPWFVDVRRDQMNAEDPIMAGVEQINMAWASPVNITSDKTPDEDALERNTVTLLSSSDRSWLSDSMDVMPRIDASGGNVSPWAPEAETGSYPLAVASTGQFRSYFAGKESPLVAEQPEKSDTDTSPAVKDPIAAIDSVNEVSSDTSESEQEPEPTLSESIDNVIERSPESARLIVFGSNDFLRDQITQMAGAATGTAYLAPFQLLTNAVDVALDDTGLLSIRSRGQFNRTLPPMEDGTRQFWEILNYALAALAIAGLFLLYRLGNKYKQQKQLAWITQ